MITDEQQWDRLKNEYYTANAEFLNFLQTLSITDLAQGDAIKRLASMRHNLVNTLLHIYMFVEDTNNLNFLQLLTDKETKKEE